jgi:hypothetical protein
MLYQSKKQNENIPWRNTRFCLGKWFPKIFPLREKSKNNPTQSPVMAAVHSIATKITNQKALRQAAQLPLNRHAPDLHTVAPGLHTAVSPQWPYGPLIKATDHHQLRIEYSLIRLSSFQARPGTRVTKKQTFYGMAIICKV